MTTRYQGIRLLLRLLLLLALCWLGAGFSCNAQTPRYAVRPNSSQQVRYVSANGLSTNNGLSWGTAFDTIANACASLTSGNSGCTGGSGLIIVSSDYTGSVPAPTTGNVFIIGPLGINTANGAIVGLSMKAIGLAGTGLRCIDADANGLFHATAADCGAGGGGSGTINAANQYSLPYYSTSGSAQVLSGLAPPSDSQVYTFTETTGAAPVLALPGIVPSSCNTTASYTILTSDRGKTLCQSGSTAGTFTLPQAGSTGFNGNWYTTVKNYSTHGLAVTTTTSTWTSAFASGATLTIPEGFTCYVQSDNTNYSADCYPQSLSAGTNVTFTNATTGVTINSSGGGGGATFQVDGTNTTSQTTINFQQGAAFNGLTPDFTNPSAGNVQVTFTGTLNNSGLTNAATTVNGDTCTLGSTCTVTIDQLGGAGATATIPMNSKALNLQYGTNNFGLDTSGNPTDGLVSYTAAVTSSPTHCFSGSYENAATPTFAQDSWCLQDVVGAGLNGTSTATWTHSGTTGTLGMSFPASTTFTAATATFNVNTATLNSTTGGFTWNGPSSSSIILNSSGVINLNPSSGNNVNTTLLAGGKFIILASSSATDIPFQVKAGTASPTGDQAEWLNSSGVTQTTLNSSWLIGKYGGTATAGQGVSWIPCETSQKSETGADASVLSCTPASAVGTYKVHVVISASAANTATLGWTATWTDSNGNAQTPTNLTLFQEGTAAPALTFTTSAAGNYHGEAWVDVNNAGTAIVVKTTFSGTSIAYKISAWVERVI